MDLKRVLYGGIAFLVWSQVVNTITAILTLGYYTNPAYFGLWSKLMMSTNGPPSSTFYAVSFAFSFITGVIYAWAYSMLGKSIPGKGARKGFNYGILLFLIAQVPFTLTMYLLLAVPAGLLVAWAVSGLVVYALSGVSFSRIMK